MPIDTASETLIPLNAAASLIPGCPHKQTLHRWRIHGVRGRKLETVLVGGRVFVSREAITRFMSDASAVQEAASHA
jgi:uncharacterized protein DUF1580